MEPSPASTETVPYRGRWLEYRVRHFADRLGRPRQWEYAARTVGIRACVVIAVLPGPPPQVVLVRQQRVPLQAPTLEFPAGLVDEHETLAEAALRELREETGYLGEVIEISPPLPTSAGLSNECVHTVRVRLTGCTDHTPEPDEDLAPVLAPVHGLAQWLGQQAAATGVLIDAKLWCYAQGLPAGVAAGAG